MQAICVILNFLVATLKSRKMKFNTVFNTVLSIVILAWIQYEKDIELFYILFFVLCLESIVPISTDQPHVGRGCPVGQHHS